MTHKIQIDDLVRDATPDEVAALEQGQAAAAAKAEAKANRAAARQAALDKLNLTADEVAALFG